MFTATDGGGRASSIVVFCAVSKEEVEAVIEADAVLLKHTYLDDGRPAMPTGKVLHECILRAEEATFIVWTAVSTIWTHLAVVMLVIVGWLGVAAIDRVRTWGTDGLH